MQNNKVNILGEEWTIQKVNAGEDPILKTADGYTDYTNRTITVENMEQSADSLKDLKVYERVVIRHEVLHAFLDEAGLRQNSGWARNEEMIDFFAIQFPKLAKIFNELEVHE